MKRIILRLDIKDEHVVNGIEMEGLHKVASLQQALKKAINDSFDEIFLHDVISSLTNSIVSHAKIENFFSKVFIPVSISGGIKKIEDGKFIINNLADKLALNSCLFENYNNLKVFSKIIGNANIIASVEAKKINNKYMCMYNSGKENSNIELISHLKKIDSFNIGEIFLQSVDCDGKDYYDSDLLNFINKKVKTPIVYGGGISKVDDFIEIFSNYNVSGIMVSNYFLKKNFLENLKHSFLSLNKSYISIINIKKILKKNNIDVRI